MTETTENDFLDGRLSLFQPKTGYRAGADPVFLAAAVDASPGQSVLDVGCGVGTGLLCLLSRVEDLQATGVDVQEDLTALAKANLDRNSLAARVVTSDIRDLPQDLRELSFDHVMTNPPFFDRESGVTASESGREIGRGEAFKLEQWLRLCLKRLRDGGRLTLINRIERLPECIAALHEQVGDMAVLPLSPRRYKTAKLFIMSAKKGARGPLQLLPPLILHEGDRHEIDGDSYTREARAILRKGEGLTLKA